MKYEYELWVSKTLHYCNTGYLALLIFKEKYYLTAEDEFDPCFITEIDKDFANNIIKCPFHKMERQKPLERFCNNENLYSSIKDLAGLLYILDKGAE